MKPKIVLAYSGGLDTSVLVHMLTHDGGYDVIACHADVGEAKDPERLRTKALKAGAVAVEVVECPRRVRSRLLLPGAAGQRHVPGRLPSSRRALSPVDRASPRRGGPQAQRPGRSPWRDRQGQRSWCASRPGGQGAGSNDLKIVALQRTNNITRDAALAYADKHGIEVQATKRSPFSVDENLWGRSIEGGELEDPNNAPPETAFAWTRSWKDAPAEPQEITDQLRAGASHQAGRRRP